MLLFTGVKHPNVEGYNMEFGTRTNPHKDNFTDVLYDLYKNIGVLNSNLTSVELSADHFKAGTTILSFNYDLNDVQESFTSYDTSPGILSLALRFAESTTEPLSLYCFQLNNTNAFYHQDGVVVATN